MLYISIDQLPRKNCSLDGSYPKFALKKSILVDQGSQQLVQEDISRTPKKPIAIVYFPREDPKFR